MEGMGRVAAVVEGEMFFFDDDLEDEEHEEE